LLLRDLQHHHQIGGVRAVDRLNQQENIQDLFIEEEMKDAYLTYAMSVIVSRALPDVRDGLKPSQRRILVAMHDLNLGPRAHYRKCAKICGDTSGNYHPHGEAVVYPTLVRMAQTFAERYPIVDGQGNFGSIDGDPPAAMRYTEARLTQLATELIEDLDMDTVDFQSNYDDTREEPTVLPGKFPNLLCNGSSGIAVGMATSIPPHNIGEVCKGILAIIEKPDIEVRDLLKIVKGPDFPTGGLICGRKGIVDGYMTGRGNIRVRARAHTEDVRGGRSNIVVTEIPYGQIKTRIIERIADCVKNGVIVGIFDVRDESDREGMRLVIELKRDADSAVVLNQLYHHTPLQDTFSIINIALDKGRPRTMNLKEIMVAYKNHRIEVIRRRTLFLLKKARAREHVLFGLLYCVANIDEIIEIIKKSPDVPTAKQRLMAKAWHFRLSSLSGKKAGEANQLLAAATKEPLHFSGLQADAILAMRLQQLTGLEVEKLRDEWVQVKQEIQEYEAILNNERLVLDVIAEDLHDMIEKYADPRRTEIVNDEDQDFDIEDLIAEESCVVTISHEGYIKRMPLTSYRRQGRGGKGVIGSTAKEGDFIRYMFTASTHDYILFFTTMGQCYWQKVYDIPQMSRQSKGRAMVNLLSLRSGETVANFIPVREFDEKRQLVFATAQGTIKKTALTAFSHPKRGGIIAIHLEKGDNLIDVLISSGSDEIVLGTRNGMAIRFKEADVRSMGRNATGVRGISLRKGDAVVGIILVDATATLLTVCENGHGKRTEFSEYRTQSRGGIGLINIRTSDRNGRVVGMMTVRDGDELMLVTQAGQMMRIGVDSKSIRPIGRATQGVRIIRLNEDDKLVAMARVAAEQDGEEGENGTAGE
jgi:DNA gyrase subunit A